MLREEAAQARHSSKLQRAMTATTSHLDGTPQAALRLRHVAISVAQKQFPSPAMNLGCIDGFESILGNLRQRGEAAVRHAGPAICLGEETEAERMVPLPPGRAR